jgi:hypothetical protein
MGSPINWGVHAGSNLLRQPLYLKYSQTAFTDLNATTIKNDIKSALASNESSELVSYLCWLLRVIALIG